MSRDKQWYELPRPAAMTKLVEVRDELRAKNCTTPRSRSSPSSRAPSAEEQKAGRTVDGTYNDLKCPMMGATGARFGRNVPLTETFPDTANLLNPNPRDDQQRALDADEVPAGHDPQRAGGGVDPVPGARLVRAPEGHDGQHARPAARRRRLLVRAADARAEDAGRSAEGAGLQPAAGLREQELALVGRLATSTAARRPSRRCCASGPSGKVRVQDDGRLFHRSRPRAPRSPAAATTCGWG